MVLHGWAFLQLKMFVLYKAALAGVAVVLVDATPPVNVPNAPISIKPTDLLNPKFSCRSCGFAAHADLNAASVIAGRAACKPATRGSRLPVGSRLRFQYLIFLANLRFGHQALTILA